MSVSLFMLMPLISANLTGYLEETQTAQTEQRVDGILTSY